MESFKMNREKVKLSAFCVQGLATLSIAYLPALTGIAFSWPSYTVGMFASNETVLSWPMSTTEISMLGSLPNIGALVATPFCEYAVNGIGRKYSAMLFGLPFVLAWLIISLTTYVPLVIAAISIAGVGAAGQAASSVYIAEISQDSIRGGLSSTLVTGFFVGLLISYTLGGLLTYNQVIYTYLSMSVVYVLLLALLKESPVFLVQKKKEQEAAKSIAFYRQVDLTSKVIDIEIKKIKLQLDPRVCNILQEQDDPTSLIGLINTQELNRKSESSWKFLMKSESSKRALAASLILMISNTFMGAIVLQVFAETLFKEAVPSMSSNLCSILLAVDFIASCLTCAIIVDRFGRKFLMTWTSVASGLCTVVIGAQLQHHFAPPWFTASMIYTFSYINYLGAATVPFIVAAEVFLPEVRGLGNSLTLASLWICNFVILMVFNPLVDAYGLGPLFYGFSVVCFLTALYSQLCLPETKGLSADAIQPLFMKRTNQN